MTLRNAFENLATEAKQTTGNTTLADILTELNAKLEPGGTVALDAATLAALETINSNLQLGGSAVSDTNKVPVSDATSQVKLQALIDAMTTVATQAAQAATTTAIDALGEYMARQAGIVPQQSREFARDTSDRMHVIVGNEAGVQAKAVLGASGITTTIPLWYAIVGAGIGSMDPREQQRELSQQTFMQTRTNRWVIT